jgi:hypothetical protein
MPTKICSAKTSGKVRFTDAKQPSAASRINYIIRELGLDPAQYRMAASLRKYTRMAETPLSPYYSH